LIVLRLLLVGRPATRNVYVNLPLRGHILSPANVNCRPHTAKRVFCCPLATLNSLLLICLRFFFHLPADALNVLLDLRSHPTVWLLAAATAGSGNSSHG
jgi:hypothetical protein